MTLQAGLLAIDNTLFDGGHSNALEVAGGTLSMTNVTIVGNDHTGLSVYGGAATVKNSIVWDNALGGIRSSGGTFAATYSDIQDAAPDPENHLLSVDPKFRGEVKVKGEGEQWNDQHPYYSLRSSSPCVNAGDATGVAADATDLSGGPRVRSGGLDLGCYEAICRGLLLLVK